METLVLLETCADDGTADNFLVFLKEELKDRCADIPCRTERRIAAEALASFSEMSRDVVMRAKQELAKDASAERCFYAAFHQVEIRDGDDEHLYTTELLLMAFVNSSGSFRRYVMPLFDEDTPEEAHQILQQEIEGASQELPCSDIPDAERSVADGLARAFLYGCNTAVETISLPLQ